jgi:hypothetical protein
MMASRDFDEKPGDDRASMCQPTTASDGSGELDAEVPVERC